MHNTKTLRRALVVAVCALLSLAIGVKAAYATGAGGWVEKKDNADGPCSLTVELDAFLDDIGSSDLVVDVYRVAGFDRELDAVYSDCQEDFSKAIETMDDDSMQSVANKMAALAPLSKAGTTTLDGEGTSTVTGLEIGIYLVVPHGEESALTAKSPKYTYTFNANIVSVPPTALDDGELRSTALIKPERANRCGSIKIIKNTVDKDGKPAVAKEKVEFTFKVVGTQPDGTTYAEAPTVTVNAGSSTGFVTLGDFEAGMKITVTEASMASGYALKEIKVGDKGDVILADDTIEFTCDNVAPTTPTTPPKTPVTPTTPPRQLVRTGDDTNLYPFYVAMLVSGVLLAGMVISGVRRKKRESSAR